MAESYRGTTNSGSSSPSLNSGKSIADELEEQEDDMNWEEEPEYIPLQNAEDNRGWEEDTRFPLRNPPMHETTAEANPTVILEAAELDINPADILTLQGAVEGMRVPVRPVEVGGLSRHTTPSEAPAGTTPEMSTPEEQLRYIRISPNPYSADSSSPDVFKPSTNDTELEAVRAQAEDLQARYNALIEKFPQIHLGRPEAAARSTVDDHSMRSPSQSPNRQKQPEKPKRIPYDKEQLGGIPEYARGQFIFQDKTKRMYEMVIKIDLLRAQFALVVDDLQKAKEHATAAGDIARKLRSQPLLARCAAWRGRAELRAGDFLAAIESLDEGSYCKGRCFEGEWIDGELKKAKSYQPRTPELGKSVLPPKLKSRWRDSSYRKEDRSKSDPVMPAEQVTRSVHSPYLADSDTESVILESDDDEDGFYHGKMTRPSHYAESMPDIPLSRSPGPSVDFSKGSRNGFSSHKRNQSGSVPAFLNLAKSRLRGSISDVSVDHGMEQTADPGSDNSDGELTAKPFKPSIDSSHRPDLLREEPEEW